MNDKKTIWSWAFYDFANSTFATLVLTFIYSTYFTKAIAINEVDGTWLWSGSVSISMLIIAILSPFLGALADTWGAKKKLLILTSWICIIATALLYYPTKGQVTEALVLFIIANVAFEVSCIFYNAYLPEISTTKNIGSISGYGWSFGYIGALLCMAIAMIGFVNAETPWFGLSKIDGENIRATNLLVAGWFALFSLPLFLFVKEKKKPNKSLQGVIRKSFSQVTSTFKEIKEHKNIAIFLLARLIYNDGLVTIFSFGAIYAAGTFNFSFEEIMIFGVALNVAAGFGAFAMGFFDDKLGGKRTIQVSLLFLIIASVIALLAETKESYWVAGILVGLASGPNQSASRSFIGRVVPPAKVNQFFGFFSFSGKLTAFLGPAVFGFVTKITESQRYGISTVIPFFVLGLIILHFVKEDEEITLDQHT